MPHVSGRRDYASRPGHRRVAQQTPQREPEESGVKRSTMATKPSAQSEALKKAGRAARPDAGFAPSTAFGRKREKEQRPKPDAISRRLFVRGRRQSGQ